MVSKAPLALLVAAPLLTALVAGASRAGHYRLTFTQPHDCERVDHWTLTAAPADWPEAPPDPNRAFTLATIPNRPPIRCGTPTAIILDLPATGPMRYWLRAHTAPPQDTMSDASNAVDLTVPPAPPTLGSVAPTE